MGFPPRFDIRCKLTSLGLVRPKHRALDTPGSPAMVTSLGVVSSRCGCRVRANREEAREKRETFVWLILIAFGLSVWVILNTWCKAVPSRWREASPGPSVVRVSLMSRVQSESNVLLLYCGDWKSFPFY